MKKIIDHTCKFCTVFYIVYNYSNCNFRRYISLETGEQMLDTIFYPNYNVSVDFCWDADNYNNRFISVFDDHEYIIKNKTIVDRVNSCDSLKKIENIINTHRLL